MTVCLTGCGEVSQKNDWIVQAIFQQAEEEKTEMGLVCRTAAEEEYRFFAARGEDEQKALEKILQQENHSFYFGHCELLFLDKDMKKAAIQQAAEFWQDPRQEAGTVKVYRLEEGPEEGEDTDWKEFFSQLEKLKAGMPDAYAYRLAGEEEDLPVPLLEWDKEKMNLKTKGLSLCGAEDTQVWTANRAALAALLMGKTRRLTWQSDGGRTIELKPVVVSYTVIRGQPWALEISLDGFGTGQTGNGTGEEDRLKKEIHREMQTLLESTFEESRDIFGLAKRFEMADSRRANQEKQTGQLYRRELQCRVNLWR